MKGLLFVLGLLLATHWLFLLAVLVHFDVGIPPTGGALISLCVLAVCARVYERAEKRTGRGADTPRRP